MIVHNRCSIEALVVVAISNREILSHVPITLYVLHNRESTTFVWSHFSAIETCFELQGLHRRQVDRQHFLHEKQLLWELCTAVLQGICKLSTCSPGSSCTCHLAAVSWGLLPQVVDC